MALIKHPNTMKLTSTDVNRLRNALAAAKIINADLAVLAGGKIMGTNDKTEAAIISELKLSIPETTRIGFGSGRLQEFEKRLMLFGDQVDAELKVNDSTGDVSLITLQSGRSKVQFRCTSLSLLDRKYPQENADQPHVMVTIAKAEIGQLSRAAKTLGAETIVIKVGRDGDVRVECADSNNDQFVVGLERVAEFVGDVEPTVFIYSADRLCALLDAGAKDYDEMVVIIGEGGSLTGIVRSHTLIIMPQTNGD